MNDVKTNLITLLESFKYPVFLQGSFSENQKYPDSFFTFWNDSADAGSHYDNDAINFIWEFTIYFYSIDATLTNTVLVSVRNLLKQNGWVVAGKGYDVACDEPTHTGRALDIIFIEKN